MTASQIRIGGPRDGSTIPEQGEVEVDDTAYDVHGDLSVRVLWGINVAGSAGKGEARKLLCRNEYVVFRRDRPRATR